MSSPTNQPPDSDSSDRNWVSRTALALDFLRAVLARVRRSRETPLQCIDAVEFARAALCDVYGTCAPAATDFAALIVNLDALVTGALHDHPPSNGAVGDETHSLPSPPVSTADIAHSLATWLDALYETARHTHPCAIDVLALRVEGWEDREIARKLSLGLRLVIRIRFELGTVLRLRHNLPC